MTFTHHNEPNWSQVSGRYPRTRSKRVYIHPPLVDSLVEVRPDLTLILKDALGRNGQLRRGHGFFLSTQAGGNPQFFDFRKVEQAYLSPKEPILFSSLAQSGFNHRLTSLTVKEPDGGSRVHLYLSITNSHPSLSRSADWYFASVEDKHENFYVDINEDYVPYDQVVAPWLNGMELEHRAIDSLNGLLLDQRGVVILRYDAAPSTRAEYAARAGEFANILKFNMELAPGETKKIHIEIFDTFTGRTNELASIWNESYLDEATAIDQCRLIWNQALTGKASIQVPESIIQAIFDTAQTNSLQLIAERADGSALPGQGGFNEYTVVYSWEVSAYLKMLNRLGYGDVVKKTLQYFLSTQVGSKGPDGDILSPKGSFRAHIFWMCETGSVLGLLADYYLTTKDKMWFGEHLPAILQACEWIERERGATKMVHDDGTKAAHYGLLPKGRVHDWPDKGHFFFSDAHTWQGLHMMALALKDWGHPDGAKYAAEAQDYRECLEAAVRRATYSHPPDEHIRWISNEVYTKPGVKKGVYAIDGPACLLDTGLLRAEDSIIPEIEYYLRNYHSMGDLFAVKLPEMEDEQLGKLQEQYAGSAVDLFYVNQAERIWHRVWCLRGEREKALRYFYSTMAFSTTLDTFNVHERYCPQLQWLSPWQPNGSGNGRVMEMIMNSLYLLEDRTLKLLPCAPAEWLEIGKRIEVNRVGTYLGELSFLVTRSSLHTVHVEIQLPKGIEAVDVTIILKGGYEIRKVQMLDGEGQDTEWNGTFSGDKLYLSNPQLEVKLIAWLSEEKGMA
ncbi:hypothetical protein D7Z26_01995 [Cohnella endophytica]|uniref:Alpha-L-rhamnosidase six-hairpin glycosidase domain-containing protein n=1 Tax=Cohnella endophytica TaxID=2419778 RepID=A0A494Y6R8_9BACL|nr:hypothetical protein [Cohnella endophytica]RKP58292.1 hypothetical protein D7Z26_01995 [Cohnella endophytica]